MSESLEIWKDVVGYEGMYQVSNLANVRSVSHVRSNGSVVEARLIKNTLHGSGYVIVQIRNRDGKKFAKYLHHVVAAAFLGRRPENMDCCHNDGNRLNNVPSNLRYDTRKNNIADRIKHGTATSLSRNDPRRSLIKIPEPCFV